MGINPSRLGIKYGRMLLVLAAHTPERDEKREEFINTVRTKLRELYKKDYMPQTIAKTCEELTSMKLLQVTPRYAWTVTESGKDLANRMGGREDCAKYYEESRSPNVATMQEMASG